MKSGISLYKDESQYPRGSWGRFYDDLWLAPAVREKVRVPYEFVK
jgi:hypothetical protein